MKSSPGKRLGNRCLCTGCGGYFNSITSFDGHRVDGYGAAISRRCLSESEMLRKGWSRNAGGFWITSQRPILASTIRVETPRTIGVVLTHRGTA